MRICSVARRSLVITLALARMLAGAAAARADGGGSAWRAMANGPSELRLRALALHPADASRLLAGSERDVYASLDAGRSWAALLQLPGGTLLNALAIDPADPRHILAATSTGLYRTADGGSSWQQPVAGPGQNAACQAIAFDPSEPGRIWLGTGDGLLASTDAGRRWHVAPGLDGLTVVALAVGGGATPRIYAATERGLFVRQPDGQSWRHAFPVSRIDQPQEPDAQDAPEKPAEERDQGLHLASLAVAPSTPDTVLLGSSEGLFVSRDAGASWQPAGPPALGSIAIRHLALDATTPATVYVVTAEGVGRYDLRRRSWQPLVSGLPTTQVTFLAASRHTVLAATELGLYRLDGAGEPVSETDWPSAQELLANFVNEPSIGQVQQAAVAHAEVQPDKIRRWRRQAALKPLLPSLDLDYDRDRDTYVTSIGSTTNPTFDRIVTAEDPSHGLGLSLTWDFGELIWNQNRPIRAETRFYLIWSQMRPIPAKGRLQTGWVNGGIGRSLLLLPGALH